MSLLGLIDDLLHIMRADAERAAFRPTEIHVTDVLEAVAASARHMSGTRDLTIDLDEQDDLPLVVSDRARLTQVILNLVTNAVKFTPDGGRIVLRARRDGADAIAIEVEDTGVGIAAEEIERVFEPFHQADGTIERGYGGVGLGLSVARRLIGLLGGSLSVESTPGVGTTFTVRVPVAHAAQSAA
jgi:signal transduction histidine kinase